MKILLCHNFYQLPGGEDGVFADEGDLLRAYGHEVVEYTKHNDAIKKMSRVGAAKRTIWNRETYRELRTFIRHERPDVMHCTNVFPLISPSAYYAARDEGVPVIQSLHNYRLLCPNALCLRQGKVCEDCVGRVFAWPAVRHACYRNSRAASATVALMQRFHRSKKTWTKAVDRYIALTEFGRQKFLLAGLPAERIDVKPNFVRHDPGVGTGSGNYTVFVGRLSHEKGISTLLDAWSRLEDPIALKIVGDGPMADAVQAAAATDRRIEWLGWRSQEEVSNIIGRASAMVLPSLTYEAFARTITESFAAGTPVISSRHGAMAELITPDRTGAHFNVGSAADLASTVAELFRDRVRLATIRESTRKEFEQKYTAAQNYKCLMAIYAKVSDAARIDLAEVRYPATTEDFSLEAVNP